MKIYVGTSGYSFKEWKGHFYPADLPQKEMLGYYSQRLSAVEINNTFYRMPKASVVEGWASQVAGDFRFVLKASRRITHFSRLKECADAVGYLWQAAGHLGPHLGPILFQLPPNFKQDLDRLAAFLDQLPRHLKAAVEFRHPSWFTEETCALLRAHDAALVGAETDDDEEGPGFEQATASWGYLRLRRSEYSEADLAQRAEALKAQPWEQAFVFFKHEQHGPAWAGKLAELLP